MLKFFFHRYSLMVRLMESIGLVGIVVIAWRLFTGRPTLFQTILFAIIIAEYAFLRFCAVYRWYPEAPRSFGIGLQFEKAMVPTSYILAIMTWIFILAKSSIILAIGTFLIAVIAHVNIILLYLHLKDRDKTPVNTYSMPPRKLRSVPFS